MTEWSLTEQAGYGSDRACLSDLLFFEADTTVPRNKTTTQPTLTEQGRRRWDRAGSRRSIFVRKEQKITQAGHRSARVFSRWLCLLEGTRLSLFLGSQPSRHDLPDRENLDAGPAI